MQVSDPADHKGSALRARKYMKKCHKKIRLDKDVYALEGAVCSITICTEGRVPFFQDKELSVVCVDMLKADAKSHYVPVYAYCFMPDHLHMVISPGTVISHEQHENCSAGVYPPPFTETQQQAGAERPHCKDIVSFVGEYKGRTTRAAWRFGIKGKFWQTSFYDHFLRKEEAVRDVVMYVLNNPVRRGLVSEWKEYPYSGSLVYEL